MRCFHVTSARNRDSIERFGLDWTRMGAAHGIAGSREPEVDGVFVCRDQGEADWFLTFGHDRGLLDVWAIDGVDESALLDNGSGYAYLPVTVAPVQLTLIERDVVGGRPAPTENSGAFGSTLTITFDDGTVLTGDDARARLARQAAAAERDPSG